MPAYTDPVEDMTTEELAELREDMGAHRGEQQLHIEHEENDRARTLQNPERTRQRNQQSH